MKRIKIDEDQEKLIQKYADKYCAGNCTQAVRELLRKALQKENGK